MINVFLFNYSITLRFSIQDFAHRALKLYTIVIHFRLIPNILVHEALHQTTSSKTKILQRSYYSPRSSCYHNVDKYWLDYVLSLHSSTLTTDDQQIQNLFQNILHALQFL